MIKSVQELVDVLDNLPSEMKQLPMYIEHEDWYEYIESICFHRHGDEVFVTLETPAANDRYMDETKLLWPEFNH